MKALIMAVMLILVLAGCHEEDCQEPYAIAEIPDSRPYCGEQLDEWNAQYGDPIYAYTNDTSAGEHSITLGYYDSNNQIIEATFQWMDSVPSFCSVSTSW